MSWQDRVAEVCEQAIRDRLVPGCSVGVAGRSDRQFASFGGLTYEADSTRVTQSTVYDVASITKVIPTSSVVLRLVEEGKLGLDDKAADYLPELDNQYRDQLLVRHLLNYTAIFVLKQRMSEVAIATPDQVMELVLKAPLKATPGEEFAYTNAPALLLGLIAERIAGRRLDELAREMFFGPLGMAQTTFDPEQLRGATLAPTEVDWRGEHWVGPHDETAWVLHKAGKVPAHAGLFSTAEDLLTFGQMLLNEGQVKGRRYLKPETIKLLQADATGKLREAASMSWRVNWPVVMGTRGSDRIFGKSGFTGCLILIDPVKERSLVLMSNRTYPHRPADGSREAIFAFWRSIADAVFAD